MSKQISVYVASKNISPSGYYRVLQYFKDIPEKILIHSQIPNNLYRWRIKQTNLMKKLTNPFVYLLISFHILCCLIKDLWCIKDGTIIISKNIVPYYLPICHCFLLRKLSGKNRIIWDFDDNIIDKGCKKEFSLLTQISDKIIVISEFLKSLIDERYRYKVELLPTTDGDMCCINTKQINIDRTKSFDAKIILIWVGTSVNLSFLKRIIPELDNCAASLYKMNKQLILKVVCNNPLNADTCFLKIENVIWSRNVAIQELAQAHIGIMPLVENRFTMGKGGFKLIQYLAIGLPVIASAVGFNKQVVSEDCGYLIDDATDLTGWSICIKELNDPAKYKKMADNALSRYYTHFSYFENKKKWYEWCGIHF